MLSHSLPDDNDLAISAGWTCLSLMYQQRQVFYACVQRLKWWLLTWVLGCIGFVCWSYCFPLWLVQTSYALSSFILPLHLEQIREQAANSLYHYNHERPWVMAVLRLYRNQTMHLNAINSMHYAWDDYLTSWMLSSLATLIKALWSIAPRLAISSVHSIKILTLKHQSGGFLKKAFSFKIYSYPTQFFV